MFQIKFKIQFFHPIYEQKKVPAIIAQPMHAKCESFHNKFNSYFESLHPNIYKFIEVLKLIQTETVILIPNSNNFKLHGQLQIRNKIIFIDTQIKKLSEKKYQILSTYKYWLKNTSLSNICLVKFMNHYLILYGRQLVCAGQINGSPLYDDSCVDRVCIKSYIGTSKVVCLKVNVRCRYSASDVPGSHIG
ncbi:hypothetical protein AGLY_001749 [Aphis glycines]|uniref:Uncharacterized protein n=1 Tax=Aphis glycines TaxID=307491 RepID=A0A6G0U5K9_APHGL|nr:hypothetical protein AGLY_001749 [Aphis glycines]